MKRFFKIFIFLLVSILLIGCGKKEDIPMEEQLADDEVVLENIKYKLDKDETGYGISYKIAENFRKTELINAIN